MKIFFVSFLQVIILTWWQVVGDDVGCEVSLKSLKIV